MNKASSITYSFNWRRPLASEYFRSAGSYLGLKLVIFSLAGLAGQYLLTHYLAREDYGLLVWVGTIIALLGPFGLPGISTSITGAVAKGYDGNFKHGTWLEMVGGTLGGLVLLGFAGYYWFWTHEETKALIFIVAGVLGPGLWLDTQQCYWNGKKNFKAIFWWSVPVRLLQLLATAIVLYYSSNPAWVFGVQTFIQVAANIGAAIGIMRIGALNRETSKDYQSYGWLSNWLYLFGSITAQIDKLIIGFVFGLEKLAIFAVGELIYNYFFKTPKGLLDQIFLPHLAEMSLRDGCSWIKKRQSLLFAGILVVVLLTASFLPAAYRLLFTIKYNESILYAYLFLLNVILGSPVLLVGALIKAHGLKRESAIAQTIISLTPLVLIFPFAYLWGLKGVVFARIGQNLALSFYYYCFIRRGQVQ
jgi:O-antigen/teichoic acid export membrane protein